MPQNVKNQKESDRAHLFRSLSLSKDTRGIALILIEDAAVRDFLMEACTAIGLYPTTQLDALTIAGADVFVSDSLDVPLHELVSHSVVPILPLNEATKKIFSEFNPMKFEGNAFLYEGLNGFLIFEKIIRALENMRYAGDKRTLMKNITETKI